MAALPYPPCPCIIIDDRWFDAEHMKMRDMGVRQGMAFISATQACLFHLLQRPIGRQLLTTIANRCDGIGAGGVKRVCRIMFGPGTLTNVPNHGPADYADPGYVQQAVEGTTTLPDMGGADPYSEVFKVTTRFRRGRMVAGKGGNYRLSMVGQGLSPMISFNPFINYNVGMMRTILVPTPPFIALGHELVHALHYLSGDTIDGGTAEETTRIEEARTVGAGQYRHTHLSENALRAEWGVKLREFYMKPGDCGHPLGKAFADRSHQ